MPRKSRSSNQPPGIRKRRVEERPLRDRFLIVCEGEKTEPNYFRKFAVPKDVIVEIVGTRKNTVKVVRKAIEKKNEGDYDQTWCVFDRDSFPPKHFNDALQLAKKRNIRVAYSNQAFELWYILHFDYQNTGIPRSDYAKRLEQELGHPYAKNSKTMYDELLPHQEAAIDNATKLLSQYDPPKPEQNDPSTTVHLLVQELNRFLRGT